MSRQHNDPNQLELGKAYARNTDPVTSHIAAAQVAQESASRMEQIVLQAIQSSGPSGMNNHELVAATGLTWNTCTPRVRPLVRKGYVRDSGRKRPGPGSNKPCIVWIAI